ncbi:hypothetical protein ACW73L_20700 [Methylolobus aquaticus]
MANVSWSQNEVAQAYDEKLLLLEAARKEYEQSVFELIEALRSALEARRSAISLDEGMAFQIQARDFPEFACRTLECALKTDTDESRVQVVARMATPWGGRGGQLQLGVLARLDDKLVPWSVEDLRSKHKDLFPRASLEQPDPAWLWAGEVNLSDADALDKARDEMEKLIANAEEVGWEIDEAVRFSKRIADLFVPIRSSLEPALGPSGWKFSSGLNWWQGMRYLQMDQSGKPTFWVGFHVKDGTLMYGHSKRNGLAQAFAQAAGVLSITYSGHPAGVWKKKEELLQAFSDDDMSEVTQGVIDLFSKFVATVNQSP